MIERDGHCILVVRSVTNVSEYPRIEKTVSPGRGDRCLSGQQPAVSVITATRSPGPSPSCLSPARGTARTSPVSGLDLDTDRQSLPFPMLALLASLCYGPFCRAGHGRIAWAVSSGALLRWGGSEAACPDRSGRTAALRDLR